MEPTALCAERDAAARGLTSGETRTLGGRDTVHCESATFAYNTHACGPRRRLAPPRRIQPQHDRTAGDLGKHVWTNRSFWPEQSVLEQLGFGVRGKESESQGGITEKESHCEEEGHQEERLNDTRIGNSEWTGVVSSGAPRKAAPRAGYVHVPFCRHRCGYCNFTLVAARDDLVPAYLAAIEQELSWLASPREVDTLFLGGGTPTHLALDQLTQLLECIGRWFPLAGCGEFSVEANPIDVTAEKARLLADHGVTRVSLGVQSFDSAKLERLERDHRRAEILRAWSICRRTFPSVAIDLIFGAPGESCADWARDVESLIQLEPDHVSCYGLTFERGTHFWSRRNRGELAAAEEEVERQMYELAIDRLTSAGWEHYEVSNFARPGHRCRHNEVYWTGGEYYAAGPGAARYVAGTRETNHRSTTTYLRRVLAGESPVAEAETLSGEAKARERLVFGMRRLEGVCRDQFAAETGFKVEELVGAELVRLRELGLVLVTDERIRLTRSGLLISDAIWPKFLAPN